MKRVICSLVITLVCMSVVMLNQVSASSINSKVGITFSNSYTPTEPNNSTEITNPEKDFDKNGVHIEKGNLPKTGGYDFISFQYIGLLLIILSVCVLSRVIKVKNSHYMTKSL